MSSVATTAPKSLVEIQGTWLANRGAEQMLRTTVAQLRRLVPESLIAVDPRWGSYDTRSQLGLLQVFPRQMTGARFIETVVAAVRKLGGSLVDSYLAGYGVVLTRDVDVLLDASGFALSDQWGAAKARERADRIEACSKRGGISIVLPQAMGPFTDPRLRREVERVLDAASLVFVRDQASLDHIRSISGGERARLAPDLTVLSPQLPTAERQADVVVVPNTRLLDAGTGWSIDGYVDALAGAVEGAQEEGRSVAVLVHAGDEGDGKLARLVGHRTGVRVVWEPDALMTKAVLGSAEAVVGSRYHALLGALLQGVPTVIVGWSHKYDELARAFEVSNLVVEPGDATAPREILTAILQGGATRERQRITAAARRQRSVAEAMWDEVAELIRQHRT